MVTCPKCGTRNPDEATFCVNCGAALNIMEGERKHGSTCFGQPERRMEDECFGLPHGGAIVGIIIGIIIVLYGLVNIYGWKLDIGVYIPIIIGILIVAGAIYRLTRRRS